MRISEILRLDEADLAHVERLTPRTIRASDKFLTAWPRFQHSFPDLKKNFDEFLRAKTCWDPPRVSGKHDSPLGTNMGAAMKGIMHSHMVFGKAILIYKVDGDYLTLYLITDHFGVEKGGINTTANSIRDIDRAGSWQKISLPAEPVSGPVADAANELFHMMDGGFEQNVLRQFSRGNAHSGMDAYLDLMPELAKVDRQVIQLLAQQFLLGNQASSISHRRG